MMACAIPDCCRLLLLASEYTAAMSSQGTIVPGNRGQRPNGSSKLIGLFPAYAYRFTPPASPIGSCVRNRPDFGSYQRLRRYTNPPLALGVEAPANPVSVFIEPPWFVAPIS